MALLSSLCPPLGLMGSIVKAITSDKPNAGLGFALDLATSVMPTGGFLGDFAVELVKQSVVDVLPGRHVSEATRKILPYSPLPAPCSRCYKKTQYYGNKDRQILCYDCISRDLSSMVDPSDNIYIFRDNTNSFHSNLTQKNKPYASYLTDRIRGSGVDIASTRDYRIPELTFSSIDDNNFRWAMSMWATLAQHWPTSQYLALFDFSMVSWDAVIRSTYALTPDFKNQFQGGGSVKGKVAIVHGSLRGKHDSGQPDPYVTWGTFGTRSDAFAWLDRYLY